MHATNLAGLYACKLQMLQQEEQQLSDALKILSVHSNSPQLQQKLADCRKNCRARLDVLTEMLGDLAIQRVSEPCPVMISLIHHAIAAAFDCNLHKSLKDAALIATVQAIEHHQMAGYGIAGTYAELLNRSAEVDELRAIVAEEKASGVALTFLMKEVTSGLFAEVTGETLVLAAC